jgi:hypothetical protein
MHVTPELLKAFQDEVERIDFGRIIITLNKNGSYFELSTEQRKRIWKNGIEKHMEHGNRQG